MGENTFQFTGDQNGLPQLPGSGKSQPKFNIKDLTDVKCDDCDHNLFDQVYAMKRLSPIISGEKKTKYIPIAVFACAKCGKLPKDFEDLLTE